VSKRRGSSRAQGDGPWWSGGLTFTCTACGDCCKGPEPGFVEVDERMITTLAEHVGLSEEAFSRRYVRRIASQGILSLIEKKNGDCVFWEDGQGCTVYEVRPTQCRTFPFWPEVLESKESWDEHAADCPGMTRAAEGRGRHYTAAQVETILGGHGATGPSARTARGRRLARADEQGGEA
jgi:Fe-S-cluster containining protein